MCGYSIAKRTWFCVFVCVADVGPICVICNAFGSSVLALFIILRSVFLIFFFAFRANPLGLIRLRYPRNLFLFLTLFCSPPSLSHEFSCGVCYYRHILYICDLLLFLCAGFLFVCSHCLVPFCFVLFLSDNSRSCFLVCSPDGTARQFFNNFVNIKTTNSVISMLKMLDYAHRIRNGGENIKKNTTTRK